MTHKRYTSKEERANALSHAVGIVLGLVAGYFLLQKASKSTDPFATGSICVYLFGMLTSYITSTWYHGSKPGRLKESLRKFDHAAIYLHIAGTYTPVILLVLRNDAMWGWGIFAFVWLSAIMGIILCFTNLKEHSHLETISFISMGCSMFLVIKPLIDNLITMNALPTFWWLIAGGASFILGALFYSRPGVKYMHSTFHVFCLGGSVCHIMALWCVL